MGDKPANAEEYLATLTAVQRAALATIRDAILTAAPGAEESFSYGMPGFRLGGEPLLWYAAWKAHYSLYPLGADALHAAGAEVERYETAKGTIRFPASEPLPATLVRKLVEARVDELHRQ